jgi:hypothetical protein
LFTLGMLVADGANGLWIARLIRRADQTARIASRVLGLALGSMSLLVAAFGVARLLNPAVDGWSDGKELAIGMGLIVMLACAFVPRHAAWPVSNVPAPAAPPAERARSAAPSVSLSVPGHAGLLDDAAPAFVLGEREAANLFERCR